MNDVVIYGAGGFAREVAQLASDLIADGAQLRLAGYLSDDESVHGTEVAGLPVLGGISYLERNAGRFSVLLGVGAPSAKQRIASRVVPLAKGFPSLIHPTVVRSSRIGFGSGVIICAMCALTVDIAIGDFAALNLCCSIGHDAILSRFVTISPGVNISGNVGIGTGCNVGTGVRVIQGKRLGDWSIIGAGTVVTADIPANCTAVGVPARVVKMRDPNWHLAERV